VTNEEPVPSALYLARRAQAKARDVRDGEIPIDALIRTLDQLAELLSTTTHSEMWFPKVHVVTGEAELGSGGTPTVWAKADIVVDTDGLVLKNKYGPTGWTDWKRGA
jgi:hypothetical protein